MTCPNCAAWERLVRDMERETALLRAEVERWKDECARNVEIRITAERLQNACACSGRAVEGLRDEVADLTRHAEAMAAELSDWRRNHTECTDESLPCPNETCIPDCPVAAYRRDHPLPQEKP